MPFASIRETVSTYRHMAKTDLSPFEDHGLGAMTRGQRTQLLKEKKIVAEEQGDAIATAPVGIVEYMPRGSELIKRFTFRGSPEMIRNQVAEAEGIVRVNKDKLINSEVRHMPLWDGRLPEAKDASEWAPIAESVRSSLFDKPTAPPEAQEEPAIEPEDVAGDETVLDDVEVPINEHSL